MIASTLRLATTWRWNVGFVLLALLVLVAVFANYVAPYDPNQLFSPPLQAPSGQHFFGTDDIGRDVYSYSVHGTRTALMVGFTAALLSSVVGIAIGAVASYSDNLVGNLLMRVTEVFQTIPSLILVLVIVALLGASFWYVVAALALSMWPLMARLAYGQFLVLREREYVLAARAAGYSHVHIMVREILPNAAPILVVQFALDIALAILAESGLSFIGLSDPSVPSWGAMLYRGQSFLVAAPWMSIFPGLSIFLAILSVNMVADVYNRSIGR